LSLILFQSTPAKNGWNLISSAPLTPSLSSFQKLNKEFLSPQVLASQISLLSKSIAAGLKPASGGITKVFFQ